MEAAGICHSDLSVVNGNRPRPVPMLLGHEAAGIVEQLGDGVDDIEVGQRVVMAFLPRCGKCKNCLTDGKLPCIPGTAANTAGRLLTGGERLHRNGQKVFHHLGCLDSRPMRWSTRRSIVPVGSDIPPQVAAVLGCAVLTGGGAVINAGAPADGDTSLLSGSVVWAWPPSSRRCRWARVTSSGSMHSRTS
jgi:alcohol dehydrogenase